MRNPLLVPDLRELILAGEDDVLREFLGDHHPGQVAEIIGDFSPDEGDKVLAILPTRLHAEVLSYLDSERQVRSVEKLDPADAATLLHLMSHDERANLVKRLDEERVDQILPHLAQAEREDIRRLASYEPGTAGAVMTTDYVTLPPNLTVRESLEKIRHEAPDRETVYYSYVVDPQRKLIGFLSLKKLILARPSARVEDIMQRDVIVARVDEDQEAVARKIAKYDLIAIPVVDAHEMLLGIITHDDALDILRREQTEDILAFGGVSKDSEADEESYWKGRIVETVRRRMGWLLMLFLAESVTGSVLRHYQWVGKELLDLALFVPLLIGTGGNAGSQTVSTVIRGLALGDIQPRDAYRVIFREWAIGLLLGMTLGSLGFLYTWLYRRQTPIFSMVIALSLLGICMWANTVGALVPIVARSFKKDPAIISAPFITTLVDATGLIIYYNIAIFLLIKASG